MDRHLWTPTREKKNRRMCSSQEFTTGITPAQKGLEISSELKTHTSAMATAACHPLTHSLLHPSRHNQQPTQPTQHTEASARTSQGEALAPSINFERAPWNGSIGSKVAYENHRGKHLAQIASDCADQTGCSQLASSCLFMVHEQLIAD